jgi:hypothetical protein
MPVRTDYLIQCILNKGSRTQVAWIPETKAKLGSVIELIEGAWRETGWHVAGVGIRLPEAIVRERSRDYINTRKASDV